MYPFLMSPSPPSSPPGQDLRRTPDWHTGTLLLCLIWGQDEEGAIGKDFKCRSKSEGHRLKAQVLVGHNKGLNET